jgi:hypothetical protein
MFTTWVVGTPTETPFLKCAKLAAPMHLHHRLARAFSATHTRVQRVRKPLIYIGISTHLEMQPSPWVVQCVGQQATRRTPLPATLVFGTLILSQAVARSADSLEVWEHTRTIATTTAV